MTGFEQSALPFPTPTDWQTSYIGEEFFVILGKMLDAEKNVGTPKPYLGNKSVRWGRIDTGDLSMIKLTPGDLRRYRLFDGDLLVCEGGDVGRSAIWCGQMEECYFQKALHRVRPRGGYSPVLLRYLLEYYSKTGFLLNFVTQTSIAHLPKDKFETLPLPKPSMQEQEAISEALSDVDVMIDGLEQLIAKKRLLKQGVMQDLLTAKRRLPGFSGEWRQVEFGSVVRNVLPKSSRPASFGTASGDYPFFLSGAQDSQAPMADYHSDGAVVFNNGGLFRARHASGKFSMSDHCIAMEVEGNSMFFSLWMECNAQRLDAVTFYGSGLRNIDMNRLREVAVPIPPRGEQVAIAEVLHDMEAEIVAIEGRLKKVRSIKNGMMQALLTGRIRLGPKSTTEK